MNDLIYHEHFMNTRFFNLSAIKAVAFSTLVLMSGMAMTSQHALANTPQVQQQALQSIFQRLAQQPMVRANFTQQKKLATMNKTFNSSGHIVFAKQHGVLWRIQVPVQADLIMTPQVVVQKTANTQSKINLTQNQYAGVASVFMQLMAGDQKTLKQHFNIQQVHYTAQNWRLKLTPKSATMQRLFAQVDISGHDYVQNIIIQEKTQGKTTGGTTHIQFSQHKNSPTSLNSSEYALFELAK